MKTTDFQLNDKLKFHLSGIDHPLDVTVVEIDDRQQIVYVIDAYGLEYDARPEELEKPE